MKLVQFLIVVSILGPAAFWSSDHDANSAWHIKGSLSEACSCAVPCTCNFGELPSPHPYCYSMYSYKIDKGRFGGVFLDGLKFGSMDARYGRTLYIDEHASDAQRAALASIAEPLLGLKDSSRFYPGQSMAHIGTRYVEIVQESDSHGNHLKLGGDGEFRAVYIIGRDGKTPVTVKNNTTWAIDEAIKAKTTLFGYHYGRNQFQMKGTNSNQGAFEYDSTEYQLPEKAAPHCGR